MNPTDTVRERRYRFFREDPDQRGTFIYEGAEYGTDHLNALVKWIDKNYHEPPLQERERVIVRSPSSMGDMALFTLMPPAPARLRPVVG